MLGPLVAVSALEGCGEPKAPREEPRGFDVVLRVSNGSERPAPNVVVRVAGNEVGATDGNGAAQLHFRGNEGESVEATLACPPGFVPSPASLHVTLMRLPKAAPPPRYEAACTPETRHIVAAIRAERGARLPITLRGQTLGWTDATGAAIVLVAAKPGERIELGLDTDSVRPMISHPRNPTFSFVAPAHDDVVLLEQKLTLETPTARSQHGASPHAALAVHPMRL